MDLNAWFSAAIGPKLDPSFCQNVRLFPDWPFIRNPVQPRRFSIETRTRLGETLSRLNSRFLRRANGMRSSSACIGTELSLSKMHCVPPLSLGQVQSQVSTFEHLIFTLLLLSKEGRANTRCAAVVSRSEIEGLTEFAKNGLANLQCLGPGGL